MDARVERREVRLELMIGSASVRSADASKLRGEMHVRVLLELREALVSNGRPDAVHPCPLIRVPRRDEGCPGQLFGIERVCQRPSHQRSATTYR